MSGTVVAVYSRVLEPNQDILITEDVTVQITNITLEVDEKSTDTSRSVLKMQHLEAHPALLQAVAGYDMSDSEDDFDSDEDEEDEDDEDSLDEDELADMSKLSKLSAASTSSKKGAAAAATNGKAAEEEDDEENDEDFDSMDDDEEDSDEDEDDYDRQEAEVQICSLLPGKVEHFNTNIILPGGEDFVFRLSGSHKVHIFGHYIVQPTPPQLDEDPYGEDEYGSEYDSEDDSDDDEDEEIDSDDLLEEDEMGMYNPITGLLNTWEMAIPDTENSDNSDGVVNDSQDVSSRFMEIEEPKETKKSKKSEAPAATATAAAATAAPASAEADKSKLSKNQLKKLAKKEKDAAAPAAAAPVAEKKAAPAAKKDEAAAKPAAAAAPTPAKKAPSKKTTLPSGLVYEDNKAGTGATAKSGQRVSMRYIGRLNNGKIFDQNTKGAPFSFKLGKGEVIKGWDEGIAGMQVGGERKLVIPAKLAYGKQGVEGIPPNSTLTFEVKLLGVK